MAHYTPESDLPPDTVVLRGGGRFSPDGLESAFHNHHDKIHSEVAPDDRPHLCWAVSVNAVPGLTWGELAAHASQPHRKVRLTTVARLLEKGFSIFATPGRRNSDGHCDAFLPGPSARLPDLDELILFEQAFDEPVPNPQARQTG